MNEFEKEQIKLLDAAEKEKRAIKFHRRLAQMEDFLFDKKQLAYWDTVAGELYQAEAVDCSIPKSDWPTKVVDGKNGSKRLVHTKPSQELKNVENGFMVDASTWWPGAGKLIENQLPTARGPVTIPGALCFNSYHAPDHSELDSDTGPHRWIDHVKTLFPNEVEHNHFFDYAAQMLQQPGTKANHGIVISGAQGIGKDTMLLPLRHGVGLWNVSEIGPDQLEESFNPYVQSIMLVVNEVRPYNESHRASSFYNRIKPMLAAPPEMLPMNDKHTKTVYVRNVSRCFMTTNDYLTMYVPEEDRRMFIMHSAAAAGWAAHEYFKGMFDYFRQGGTNAVISWLLERDISKFNPEATPPVTEGKRQVMGSTKFVRRSIIDDAFEDMVAEGTPPDVFFNENLRSAFASFDDSDKFESALKHPSLIHKMQELGYDLAKKEGGKRWKWTKTVGDQRIELQTPNAYVKRSLPMEDREKAIDEAGRALVSSMAARKSKLTEVKF